MSYFIIDSLSDGVGCGGGGGANGSDRLYAIQIELTKTKKKFALFIFLLIHPSIDKSYFSLNLILSNCPWGFPQFFSQIKK